MLHSRINHIISFLKAADVVVGIEEEPGTGEGSTHTRPNQSAEVQDFVELVRDGALEAEDETGVVDTVMLGSLHPKKPGDLQAAAELLDDEELEEVVVRVGTGTTVFVVMVVVSVYVVDPFLQPNQPGVRQVVTVVVLV